MNTPTPSHEPRRILLVGHGLLSGGAPDEGLRRVVGIPAATECYRLPVPAFVLRPQVPAGASRTAHVAERLAELDDLERAFEQVAVMVEAGGELVGLAVPGRLLASTSGRAWLERVQAIAKSIANLTPEVWTVTGGQATPLDDKAEQIRTAS